MAMKNELFQSKVKLITNNLKKKINGTIDTKNTYGTRIKIPYNELVRDVLGKTNGNMERGNKQTFKNIFSINKTSSLKSMMKHEKSVKR